MSAHAIFIKDEDFYQEEGARNARGRAEEKESAEQLRAWLKTEAGQKWIAEMKAKGGK